MHLQLNKQYEFDYFVAPSSSSFQINLFISENIANLHYGKIDSLIYKSIIKVIL